MKNLIELLEDRGGKIKLEISGADLMDFANVLIRRAKNELAGDLISKQKYLTKSEVQELFGVSLTTL